VNGRKTIVGHCHPDCCVVFHCTAHISTFEILTNLNLYYFYTKYTRD
jgi:hypothetical protein